jgi:integrase
MRRNEHALTIPTAEQVGKLIASAESPFQPFIALCAFAGLRLGEAAGVQVGDIDFLGRTLHVTRQIQRENGRQIEIRPPKYGSERDVYIPDELTTMLSAHIKKHGAHGDGWLFVGTGDDPPHRTPWAIAGARSSRKPRSPDSRSTTSGTSTRQA